MAKVKNVRKVLGNVTKRFRDVANSKEFINAAATVLEDQSKGSARLGRNPTTEQSWKQGLAPSTIATRKYLRRYNKVGKPYGDAKDNLTLTGQLINSIKAVVTRKRGSVNIKLEIEDSRQGYKTKSGRRLKTKGNKFIEAEQKKRRRVIRGISDRTVETIRNQFLSILRRKG